MKKRLAIIIALVMMLTMAVPFAASALTNQIDLRVEGDA